MELVAKSHITDFSIRRAQREDVPLIFSFIRELAEYEKLLDSVSATEEQLAITLFEGDPSAEVVIGEYQGIAVGFALFFHTYSTFLAKPGLYLEDLYIKPEYRGSGFGRAMLSYLAALALERKCGRFEWSVLNWNTPAIELYKKIGAEPMREWTVQRVTGQALENLAKGFAGI